MRYENCRIACSVDEGSLSNRSGICIYFQLQVVAAPVCTAMKLKLALVGAPVGLVYSSVDVLPFGHCKGQVQKKRVKCKYHLEFLLFLLFLLYFPFTHVKVTLDF